MIIQAGINDLLYGREGVNAEEVAKSVVEIGKRAKDSGVSDVFIMGLYKVDGVNTVGFNNFLKQKCMQYNFGFVHNSNIYKSDLFDGLHVNRQGNDKLKHNLLQSFDTYYCNEYSNAYY